MRLDMDGKMGIRSSNNDRIYAFCGPEGIGKSNLVLGMFDEWYTAPDLLGVKDYGPEYIKYLGANQREFVLGLRDSPRYHFVVHDEVLKDLYSRDSVSTFSKMFNKASFVFRGLNKMIGLVCPSILDLDANFRKRRIAGMFWVYARGKVSYYGRAKLAKLIPALMRMQQYNARPDPKNALDDKGRRIMPDFTDTFPVYKGPLLEQYLKRKEANMTKTINDLVERFDNGTDPDDPLASKPKKPEKKGVYELYGDKIAKYFEEGLTINQISKKLRVGGSTIHQIRYRLAEEGRLKLDL